MHTDSVGLVGGDGQGVAITRAGRSATVEREDSCARAASRTRPGTPAPAQLLSSSAVSSPARSAIMVASLSPIAVAARTSCSQAWATWAVPMPPTRIGWPNRASTDSTSAKPPAGAPTGIDSSTAQHRRPRTAQWRIDQPQPARGLFQDPVRERT